MTSIFKNKALNEVFDKKGYVIQPFLSDDDIAALFEMFNTADSKVKRGFYASTDSGDPDYRRYVNTGIKSVLQGGQIEKHIEGYKPFYTGFITKKPATASEVAMHTDWSIYDESRYTPLTVWCPLVDVNADNGCMHVVEGSHKLTNPVRGPWVKEYYTQYYPGLLKSPLLKPLPMKKGEGLFYHNALLHYSPHNTTGAERPAIIIACYPEGVDCTLYYRNRFIPFSSVKMYSVTSQFFDVYDKKSFPVGAKYQGKATIRENGLTENEFYNQLNRV